MARSRELVAVEECPDCGTDLSTMDEIVSVEEPLVRGGGYGAARVTRKLICVDPCLWQFTYEVSEQRPIR